VLCGVWVLRADVLLGIGVQPERRELERAARDQLRLGLRLNDRIGGLLPEGHVHRMGDDVASGLPFVELARDVHPEVRKRVCSHARKCIVVRMVLRYHLLPDVCARLYLQSDVNSPTPSPTTPQMAVSSFVPVNTQVSGATTVTMVGVSFSSADLTPSAYRSGRPCTTSSWTTVTLLVCTATAPVVASGA
jgi:hypothetical protein